MAPIRRYLRITKYSVLECRIYVENPSDSRWLLNPKGEVLPRVFAAIRPLILPKLREENERRWARKKSKVTKDVIAEDDFEVGVFLRDSRTRHSLLTRSKTFNQPKKDEDTDDPTVPFREPAPGTDTEIIIESGSESEVELADIPEATGDESTADTSRKRQKKAQAKPTDGDDAADEKKLGFSTRYEGFNISGWVLCLLIARKGDHTKAAVKTAEANQPLMEQWISTQAQEGMAEG